MWSQKMNLWKKNWNTDQVLEKKEIKMKYSIISKYENTWSFLLLFLIKSNIKYLIISKKLFNHYKGTSLILKPHL